MAQIVTIKKNSYHDSVSLMMLSKKLLALEGVQQAIVSMATPMNKELLAGVGMLTPQAEEAGGNDLLVAIQAADDALCESAVQQAFALLQRKADVGAKSAATQYKTIGAAARANPQTQMAVISTAGQFAAHEAMEALKAGLHVMLFSDNVSLEEEIRLKQYAHEKGLLIMGPDCGTAIIGGVGLCFANVVGRGDIGLVAAAGTGLQEVSTLIDRLGGGISQAIGVGGRDLSADVGGLMMLDGLKLLGEDEKTNVIVIISKPPYPEVRSRILACAQEIPKKVVVCFVGDHDENHDNILFASSLAHAAELAVKSATGTAVNTGERMDEEALKAAALALAPTQKYIRALYCGGTLAAEAEHIMRNWLNAPVYSNISKKPEYRLKDAMHSEKHAIVDLGDDIFTAGRAHPMIDPTVRLGRLVKEAEDEETAVLLLDFELGYGSHEDPVGATADAIRKAQEIAKAAGRRLALIGYVLGTRGDPQNWAGQVQKLQELGVMVAESNWQAVNMAVAVAAGRAQG